MCVPAPCLSPVSPTPTGALQGEPSRDLHFGRRLSPSCRIKVARGTISVPFKSFYPLSRAALDHVCPQRQSARVGFMLVVAFQRRR